MLWIRNQLLPVAFSFLGLKYNIILYLDENEHLRSGPQFLGDPNLFLCLLVMFLTRVFQQQRFARFL